MTGSRIKQFLCAAAFGALVVPAMAQPADQKPASPPAAATSGSALLASIVCYDIAHKRFPLAPVLMAACRFLLYLVAASAAHDHATEVTVWRALALAAYIIGLSCLARSESTSTAAARWPIALGLAGPARLCGRGRVAEWQTRQP